MKTFPVDAKLADSEGWLFIGSVQATCYRAALETAKYAVDRWLANNEDKICKLIAYRVCSQKSSRLSLVVGT